MKTTTPGRTSSKPFDKKLLERALRMHDQGLMYSTIAAKLGVDNYRSLTNACIRLRKEQKHGAN